MIITILKIILWLILIVGAFMVSSGIFSISSNKSRKALKNYFKVKKKSNSDTVIDNMLNAAANKISKYISLNSIKHSKYKKILRLADIEKTPEEWFAYQYILCGAIALCGLIIMLFSKFGMIMFGLAGAVMFMQIRSLKKVEAAAKKDIERELPKFVSYVRQIMNTHPDALSILTDYRATNEKFAKELKYTIADIRSSDYVSGITRWESRVGSQRLKQVTHGLISIYYGTYDKFYFDMLDRDFSAFEINELKKDIKKIPERMQLPKVFMVMSVLFTLFTPLILTIIQTASQIFNQ